MDERIREFAKRNGFEPTEELPPGYCSRVYADATRILKAPFQGEEITSGLVAAQRLSDTVSHCGSGLGDRVVDDVAFGQRGVAGKRYG